MEKIQFKVPVHAFSHRIPLLPNNATNLVLFAKLRRFWGLIRPAGQHISRYKLFSHMGFSVAMGVFRSHGGTPR